MRGIASKRWRRSHRARLPCLAIALLLSACSGTVAVDDAAGSPNPEPAAPSSPGDGSENATEPGQAAPSPSAPSGPAQRFVPAGRVGDADAYQQLIERLAAEVPVDLRNNVPWPDLRNADPATVQLQIFDLWIWMQEHYPEPFLAEAMSADGSPSREEIVSHFGDMVYENELRVEEGEPYRAFDQHSVTFETAGLPLWLGRDVPADAVVVYYTDSSGPSTYFDRTTNERLYTGGGVPPRRWLSIMVPTDVGWVLFRDQLLEAADLTEPDTDQVVPGTNQDGSVQA